MNNRSYGPSASINSFISTLPSLTSTPASSLKRTTPTHSPSSATTSQRSHSNAVIHTSRSTPYQKQPSHVTSPPSANTTTNQHQSHPHAQVSQPFRKFHTFMQARPQHAGQSCMYTIPILLLNILAASLTTAYVTASLANPSQKNFATTTATLPQPPTTNTPSSYNAPHAQATRAVMAASENVSAIRNRADWIASTPPPICSQIAAFPQPLRKNCSTAPPIPGTPKCNPSRPMMFSQYGEDYFLYTRHFSKMKGPGVYLDIATNNPISISNTYFLDRCLGWSGICVEANSRYFESIHRERSCAFVPTCAAEHDGKVVEFALSGPGSGIISTHRQGEQIKKAARGVERKTCVSVQSQLARYGVREVDYFNLDVEGGELSVLKGIDWDAVTIRLISVEIAPQTEGEIDTFLVERGFSRIDNESPGNGLRGMPIYPSNRFYVHKSTKFGNP